MYMYMQTVLMEFSVKQKAISFQRKAMHYTGSTLQRVIRFKAFDSKLIDKTELSKHFVSTMGIS